MGELIGGIVSFLVMFGDITIPLLILMPLLTLILGIIAIKRHVRDRQRVPVLSIISLSLSGTLLIAGVLSYYANLVPRLIKVSPVLFPATLWTAALFLAIGFMIPIKNKFGKLLLVCQSTAVTLWLLVFGCMMAILSDLFAI